MESPVRISRFTITNEDYGLMYGLVSYDQRRVLDIGADIGSTADFFLRNGALEVIAVEGDPWSYARLEENAQTIPGIRPVQMYINDERQMEELLTTFSPDIVKADCEGCEVYLLLSEDVYFSIPKAYVIETHSLEIEEMMIEKLQHNGYTIIGLECHCWWTLGIIKVVTAVKN